MIRATIILDNDESYAIDYEGNNTLDGVKQILGNAINSSLMYRRMLDVTVEGKTIFIMPEKVKRIDFVEIKESEPV